jgi:serine/threonine-protein kinase
MGRYLVYRVVADGGMGRVYEALDKALNRHVAVKILHPDVARDDVSMQRFKREYEVSKALPHEHIIEVVDFQATDDGSFALVLEFLVGEELRATLKREKVISPARAIRMLSQVAMGLDLAHSRKLIHRDLKPDNIFLCQTVSGDLSKVLDFGSVKDKNQTAKQLTVMGTTIGSPYYMAPEQAQALETLDQRADVWSLAAIFYEVVAGVVPFKGVNGPSILLEILTKEPLPISEAARGRVYPVPASLDRVLERALTKLASLRTNSAGEFADEVGAAYGLGGDHREWALIDEAQLGAIIENNLARGFGARAEPQDPVAGFFGATNPLGEGSGFDFSAMDAAFADANHEPQRAGASVHFSSSSELGRSNGSPRLLQNSERVPSSAAGPLSSFFGELKGPHSVMVAGVLVAVIFLVCGVVLGLVFLL